MSNYYHYYVEGATEKKLIDALKSNHEPWIIPGKTEIFNIKEERISELRLRSLSNNTTVILVFDTDTKSTSILKDNIKSISEYTKVKRVICIPQHENLEEELIHCTDIRNIKELINSVSEADFKRDFLKEKNILKKLMIHQFDIQKLWEANPSESYEWINNESRFIKIGSGKISHFRYD